MTGVLLFLAGVVGGLGVVALALWLVLRGPPPNFLPW